MRNRHIPGFCFLLLFLGAGFVWAKSQAIVGMVTEIQGQAYWQNDSKKKNISELAELSENSKLVLSKGSKLAVMYLQSGQQYELRGPSLVQFKIDRPIALNGLSPVKVGATAAAESKIRIEPKKVQTAGQTLVSTEPKIDPNLPVAVASAPPPPPPPAMAAPSPVKPPDASAEAIAAARAREQQMAYETAKQAAEVEAMAARQRAESEAAAAAYYDDHIATGVAPVEPASPPCPPPAIDSGTGQAEASPCSDIKD